MNYIDYEVIVIDLGDRLRTTVQQITVSYETCGKIRQTTVYTTKLQVKCKSYGDVRN